MASGVPGGERRGSVALGEEVSRDLRHGHPYALHGPSPGPELLTEALGVALPSYNEARLVSVDLTQIAVAVLPAVRSLGDERARFYGDLVPDSLNEAARRALETMMKGYGYQIGAATRSACVRVGARRKASSTSLPPSPDAKCEYGIRAREHCAWPVVPCA